MKKVPFTFLLLIFLSPYAFSQSNIKTPNVSGMFYDANPQKLSRIIDAFFSAASVSPVPEKVKILISPHAGYVYSGPVAAYGYKAISQQPFSTIVIIAPSHHFGFNGFALWPQGGFQTPLGIVPVDEAFGQKLIEASGNIKANQTVFDKEHALEVQIPFLQKSLKDFKIVPLLTGQPDYQACEDLANALQEVIGDRDDVLILVSTDMSHYHGYDAAKKIDRNTLNAITNFQPKILFEQCYIRNFELCGFSGAVTALLYAQKQGIDGVQVLKYATSGDVIPDKSRVVGYSSIIFYKKKEAAVNPSSAEQPSGGTPASSSNGISQEKGEEVSSEKVPSLNLDQKKKLMAIAKTTIDQYVRTNKIFEPQEDDPRLLLKEGAFVTIHKQGDLRGCIGNIIGRQPLYKTVRDMAIAAATQDPRFTPLKESELKDIEVEISVLSEPRVIKNIDEFQIGKHGAIVSQGIFHQGVFLPQVGTEQGWSKEEFFANLCAHKAGLPPNAWKDPRTKIEIFSAEVFSENETE